MESRSRRRFAIVPSGGPWHCSTRAASARSPCWASAWFRTETTTCRGIASPRWTASTSPAATRDRCAPHAQPRTLVATPRARDALDRERRDARRARAQRGRRGRAGRSGAARLVGTPDRRRRAGADGGTYTASATAAPARSRPRRSPAPSSTPTERATPSRPGSPSGSAPAWTSTRRLTLAARCGAGNLTRRAARTRDSRPRRNWACNGKHEQVARDASYRVRRYGTRFQQPFAGLKCRATRRQTTRQDPVLPSARQMEYASYLSRLAFRFVQPEDSRGDEHRYRISPRDEAVVRLLELPGMPVDFFNTALRARIALWERRCASSRACRGFPPSRSVRCSTGGRADANRQAVLRRRRRLAQGSPFWQRSSKTRTGPALGSTRLLRADWAQRRP